VRLPLANHWTIFGGDPVSVTPTLFRPSGSPPWAIRVRTIADTIWGSVFVCLDDPLETTDGPFIPAVQEPTGRPSRIGKRLIAIRLRNAEQGSTELAQYRSLSVQAINFHPDRRRQRRVWRIPAKFAEFMLEMLLSLRRDIPMSPLPLEFGDELSGCGHSLTIEETDSPGSRMLRTNVSD
jgi:hypothetical protein